MEKVWLIDVHMSSSREGFGILQYKAMKEFEEEGKYTEEECREAIKYLRRQIYNKKNDWCHFRKRILKNADKWLKKKKTNPSKGFQKV